MVIFVGKKKTNLVKTGWQLRTQDV